MCNPMRMCPNSPDTQVDLPSITPKKLLNYKRGLVAKKNQALAAFQQSSGSPGDRPPDPDSGGTGGIAIPGKLKYIIFCVLKLLYTLYPIGQKISSGRNIFSFYLFMGNFENINHFHCNFLSIKSGLPKVRLLS